jgi:hypothetical protein
MPYMQYKHIRHFYCYPQKSEKRLFRPLFESIFSVSARILIGSVNPAKLIKDSENSAEVFQKAFELGD